jgi:hypothetical protein
MMIEKNSEDVSVRERMTKKGKTVLTLAVAALLLFGAAEPAYASCGICTNCRTWQRDVRREIGIFQNWFSTTFWTGNFVPALRNMTGQIVTTMMLEARMIGGFMDAQNHLTSQLALQELAARSMKNYTPSESVCQFGTLSRSLAASQARGRNTQLVLNERSQARQLGKKNMASATSPDDDRVSRLEQFRARFCDVQDNNNGMSKLCGNTGAPSNFHNLDIDFTRAVDTRPTLNIDFTDTTLTNDESNIMALASNLYSHEVFRRYAADELKPDAARDNRTDYMDMRAILAKRNVAENSFNTLVGMKSAGSRESRSYVRQVLQNLGMQTADIDRYMASQSSGTAPVTVNPSYSAQMEILTKKIYQDPAFYANLMDKPANVQRQYAAMQSFGLMQQRDIFETILRSEMLLSVIVELEIAKYQNDIQNRLNLR